MGVFLDGGGLFGTEDAVSFVVRRGEVTVVSTLRQISTGPEAPGD